MSVTCTGAIPWDIPYVQQTQGIIVSQDSISWVKQCQLHGQTFYVKYYKRAGKGLRRWFGRSRIRGEWENLQYFARLGIPTPPLVAWGEQRSWGFFQGGFLVTQALPDTCNVQQFFEEGLYKQYDPQVLRTLIKSMANYTAQLHNEGFIHNDLKWRNILVRLTKAPTLYFIDCPLGGKRWQQSRGKRKDLAHLDKLAKRYLSRTLRLYFYHCYKDSKGINTKDKAYLKRINAYWDQR